MTADPPGRTSRALTGGRRCGGPVAGGRRRGRWSARGERGSGAAVELVIVVPATMMMLALAVAGGRIWMAESAVEQSAGAAARAASLDRSGGAAAASARDVANSNLASSGLECVDTSVSVNTAAFSTPVGTPGRVTVRVSCTVTFADLLLPGMSGSRTLDADGVAALDTHRSRR